MKKRNVGTFKPFIIQTKQMHVRTSRYVLFWSSICCRRLFFWSIFLSHLVRCDDFMPHLKTWTSCLQVLFFVCRRVHCNRHPTTIYWWTKTLPPLPPVHGYQKAQLLTTLMDLVGRSIFALQAEIHLEVLSLKPQFIKWFLTFFCLDTSINAMTLDWYRNNCIL